MHSLPELQQRFAAAVLNVDGHSARHDFAAQRVAVYRNNWREGFRKALASGFPVLARLVGEDYFRQLSLEFLAVHPSRSGDLEHIGAPLAYFLRGRFATNEYAYLADIAELEWVCQQVLVAPEVAVITVDDLRAMDPASYCSLRLCLHPAARLVESRFPILRIWLANQPDADIETIDLASGGEQIMVRYTASGLALCPLREPEFTLAKALTAATELGEALAAAHASAPDADLASALHRLLTIGAITRIQPGAPQPWNSFVL